MRKIQFHEMKLDNVSQIYKGKLLADKSRFNLDIIYRSVLIVG